MKQLLWTIVCCTALQVSAQKYQRIHRKAVMVDTHNDLLTAVIEKKLQLDSDLKGKTHSDLNRFLQAGVDLQLFSVWCDGEKQNPFAWANREMDTLLAVAQRNPDKLIITDNFASMESAWKQGKLVGLFGVEGGHMIENDLTKLDQLYAKGARYMTLTWNNSTSWASSAWDETMQPEKLAQKGLTPFGKQVVQRMNQLGMLVDLSHVGVQTFWDAMNTTTKPVLVSHSNCHAICPVPRNLTDEQIKAIGKNGGVIHLNFYSGFVDSSFKQKETAFLQTHTRELDSLKQTGMQQEYAMSILTNKYADEVYNIRPTLDQLLNHLDHIVRLIGVDHVGMGSDFDGITSAPKELNDVTDYPLITKALLERGYSKKDIEKILGKNFLRILKANQL
ncbi:MAG TPA: membrane dipeptidase [Chitinophagaceae bacterium]|nr:membrane dipeptidase [Chitinophagaceae bacterium]